MKIFSLLFKEEKSEANLWELERTEKVIWPEINCPHVFAQSVEYLGEDKLVRTFKCTHCVAEKKAYYKKIIKNKEGDKQ